MIESQQQQKSKRTRSIVRRSSRARPRDLEAVRIAANSYCLRHFGVGYSGGDPQRLLLRDTELWIVPAVLTSPGYGIVGAVGVVAVDAATHEIVGATPEKEVRTAGSQLAEEKQDDLKAAFHRARKA